MIKLGGMGWIPDRPDHRDHIYSVGQPTELPVRVDLEQVCPKPYDQLDIGACTFNVLAGLFEFALMKQKLPVFTPSRLGGYYMERAIEGTVASDAGAALRTGMLVVNADGVFPEDLWPYDVSKVFDRPPQSCYHEASLHKSIVYARVTRVLYNFRYCLASGYPFAFGFSVYESFTGGMAAVDGVLNMPSIREKLIGGHAVMVVGYDDTTRRFKIRNSYGTEWGKRGYFTMPYDYLLNPDLSDDFWTIRLVK